MNHGLLLKTPIQHSGRFDRPAIKQRLDIDHHALPCAVTGQGLDPGGIEVDKLMMIAAKMIAS